MQVFEGDGRDHRFDGFKFGNGRGNGDGYKVESPDSYGFSPHRSAFAGYGLEDGCGVGNGSGNLTPGLQG